MWPGIVIIVILIVVAAVVVIVLLRKRKPSNFAGAEAYRNLMGVGSTDTTGTTSNDPATEKLRQNLRVKYLYQEEKIDAAIAIERERNPSGTDSQLMQAAITRWERDNA